ncbi:NYN domain-containing protein [Enorma sp.]|uniref:NYN domain-containing protein n=1 Tax=Enorma sp. TaxID=1920692 RepID=UPI0025B9B020|nr:NYN domain-containing protein [Enorma sp.]
MSKKSRKKAKAKRFGEGSARAAVNAATYGAGNAFASAFAPASVVDPARGTNARGQRELLVVDGYNVIHAAPRYEHLIFDHSDDPYSSDVYDRARTALIADVAAFAQRRYEPVIVFDGAGNVSADRPNLPQAGVRIEFSPTGVSADTVVQHLCTEAREAGRACSVVTSDGTIQATVMGKGVTRISARMFVEEMRLFDADVKEAEEAPQVKLTLGSRLSPDTLAKLEALRNRMR